MWKPYQIGQTRLNLLAITGYFPQGRSLIVDTTGVRYTFNEDNMSGLDQELARLDGAIAELVSEG